MSVFATRLGKAAGLLLVVSLFLVTPASASTITVSGGPVSCNSTLTASCSASMDLDLFDATLGTLTGVSVEIQGDVAWLIGFTIGNSNVAKIGTTTTLQVTDAMGTVFTIDDAGLLDVNGLDKNATYAPGYFPVAPSSGTATFSYWIPTDLSPFIGSGSVPFPAFGVTAITTAIPGPQLSGIAVSSLGTLNATVTYTYDAADPGVPETTPVPEPATYALFGLGLIGVARKFRRR